MLYEAGIHLHDKIGYGLISAPRSVPRAVAVVPFMAAPTDYITAPHVFRTWGAATLGL